MTLDRLLRLELAAVRLPDWGWHYDDAVLMEKLANSLERHGQLSAVVVRETDAGPEVVDGRRRVSILRALGHGHVTALSVGRLTDLEAIRLALDLELRFEVDYVRLAWQVRALAEGSDEPAQVPGRLAATTPWDQERIGYFVRLADFDWSQFSSAPDEQAAFGWDIPEAALEAAPAAPAGPPAHAAPEAGLPDPLPEPAPVEAPAAVLAPAQVPGPGQPPAPAPRTTWPVEERPSFMPLAEEAPAGTAVPAPAVRRKKPELQPSLFGED